AATRRPAGRAGGKPAEHARPRRRGAPRRSRAGQRAALRAHASEALMAKRDLWSGTLSFGLVAVPVRMVSAVRDRDIHFHEIDEKTGERIEIRRTCEKDKK